MFKNLTIYRVGPSWQPTQQEVEEALAKGQFLPCGPSEPLSLGWVPPRGIEHAPLVEVIDGHLHLKLTIESRVLPGSVVKERVDEIAAQIEEQTGRKPGKKALKDLKEQATHELLPLCFKKRSSIRVWIAPEQRLLMIDASSPARCEEVVSLLIKALDGLTLHLVQSAETPAACMAAWLMDGVPPEGFTIDRECELKSEDEMKSVVRYARHALDIEEVRQHLSSGKRPTKLAMSYKDRVSFLLTDTLAIKKIAFLDLVFEGHDKPEKDEQFDADAVIATGELAELIPALIEGLGGEHDFLGSAPKSLDIAELLPPDQDLALVSDDVPPWA
ncbi:recombination-associated protein RdgC [Paucibacter sp. O1-1]|uniref:recombination-associated protein RdgC n=1 Tax=Paucibacter sp. M5-1 TaxID=3015998 RepID=UPI0021D4E264|nr:recombination-associated protein RdgC [Paucibacter sp. M5-1]MCU7375237.1 recombination-associated protein RdgC [Paucibacter sp. O1-1]MCZ7881147.1 recombination-associated protein RdgC [Paucibacter sp. M5-1]MDA3830244.1 recombination-associated protein RdgC [Paucibacter sp. O1-1]